MKGKLKNPDFVLASTLPMPSIPEIPSKDSSKEDPEKSKNDMWTDKYRPRGFADLVGNNGVISQLYEWLKDWDEVCIRGNKKQLPMRRGMAW